MNGNIDVFFSYHTDSSVDMVEETAKLVENFGMTCWYAKRDIKPTQNYTMVVPPAIRACALFVVLLNKYSVVSKHVSREINIAMNENKPILFFHLDDSSLESNSVIYVSSSSSQVVSVTQDNIFDAAQQMCRTIIEWFETENNGSTMTAVESTRYKTSWDINSLDFFGDEGERHRIGLQHKFVYSFAKDVYNEVLPGPPKCTFLDIGCNTGTQSKMFLEDKPHITYIGIDREEAALEQAGKAFPQGHLYVCDCEDDDFDDKLSEIEEELGISGFDIINLSMVLLHTKNPAILIDVLSKHLSDNGQIIVLDIDDGFNVAFPDPDGMFERAIHLCFKTEYSGFRHSGRAINKFFVDTDLRDVKLHKIGLTTLGMSRREKDDFFEVYFWFVLDDLRKMSEENPDDVFVKAEYEWIRDNYAIMKNEFKKKEFFFNLGFMIFSARVPQE